MMLCKLLIFKWNFNLFEGFSSSKRKKVAGTSDEFQASVGSMGKQSIIDEKTHNELEDDKYAF
jgi:hypothetical protein